MIFLKRHVKWSTTLRFAAALFVCLALTGVFYLSLPDGATSKSQRDAAIIGSEQSRLMSSQALASSHPITVIIRDFEDFENSISETVGHIAHSLGDDINVLIVADNLPYPPLNLSSSRTAQILTLSSDLSKNYSSSCTLGQVKSKYILFIPDGVKISDWSEITKATQLLDTSFNLKAVAIGIGNNPLDCSKLNVSLKEWTVSFRGKANNSRSLCSYVEGVHALVMRTENLQFLTEPFARPFPYTFYVQATLKQWGVVILRGGAGTFKTFRNLFNDFHFKWKRKQNQAERLKNFYKRVGIKREVLKSGMSNFYGCSKKTSRCFGTVVNDMPQYLYEGKWTPPCCLQILRETAAHVFGVLDKCKARYWLEGGSLLGFARHGDIIPWDYDVDVGIYLDDVEKCHPLAQSKLEPYIDDKDFVWEKVKDKEFYHVQYSQTNHLHVDIFPFYSKDGVMTKNSWFATHPQDTEFPESFLIPLTRVKFAGIDTSAPNHILDFLEYKFGKNATENPRYPNKQSPVL